MPSPTIELPTLEELEDRLSHLRKATHSKLQTVAGIYWFVVFACGVFSAILVFFLIHAAPIPEVVCWIISIPAIAIVLVSTVWLCVMQYAVADYFVHSRSKLRRLNLLCRECGYRLDVEKIHGIFEVTRAGRCYSCASPVVSDPPPLPKPDPVLESPFAPGDYDAARLVRAFEGDCRFSRFEKTIELVRAPIGLLRLPTGQIVACDPLYVNSAEIIEHVVAPGDYLVDLLIATETRQGAVEDERIACSRIILRDRPAVSFDPVYSYGVDNATGCFVDKIAAELLKSKCGPELHSFWEQLRAVEDDVRRPTRAWGSIVLDEVSGANIVFFTTGIGDGVYSTYVGRDESGEAVSLVTDFGLLFTEQDLRSEATRPWWRLW